ncbi:von Willebrand factor type A domain protein [Dictyocaulus viviparus]|uniref:von Willebrand factor type A domain protein n=1 Tax=Dictyocaulus viviparus TaxID=29172 RepID=A0A0D8Y3M5_DICVI|nr:von Willebrand factor type A domain protein [Dictyocaulus viviparus]
MVVTAFIIFVIEENHQIISFFIPIVNYYSLLIHYNWKPYDTAFNMKKSRNIYSRCVIRAQPLDLILVLDSSGSLRDQFQDEIDVIRRIVKHVTIDEKATRVMLIQFSGTQHLEFNFNQFTTREESLAALDVLRHVSGITRIGGALEFTIEALKDPANGVRDASVPKIVYLLTDGRTHDYPKDLEMVEALKKTIPNVDIWAYGTGNYVAMAALLNYTQDENKIVTNANLDTLTSRFDRYRGTETCEKIPSCVKGSDKPVDLALIIDASESLDQLFKEQIHFVVERIMNNINVHPEAVRLALITYSGKAFVHFKFNDRQFNNNTAVINHLSTLRSIKGTTSTNIALKDAFDLFTSQDISVGTRTGVPKLVIILTDGHSSRSPKEIADELRSMDVTILAVSVTPEPHVDTAELLDIAGNQSRVFTPKNAQDFEAELMKYVGFGCEGLELGPDAILDFIEPRVRGATDVSCNESSVMLTVRTQRPMNGLMYAQNFYDDPRCLLNRDGYNFNITVILQFHPLIITRADQGLDVKCFYQQPLSLEESNQISKRVDDTVCSYRIHRYSPSQCVALDAKVGETLYHKWQCDSPPHFNYLVHNCYAKSERSTVEILDSEGQEMSVFKFPGEDNMIFQCKISLCDTESEQSTCTNQVPPRCTKKQTLIAYRDKRSLILEHMTSQKRNDEKIDDISEQSVTRSRRNVVPTKQGFYMTLEVETRTLNVLLNENIRPENSVKYCDIS